MIRDEDCYKGLDTTVKSFTASLPLVGELRSPAMRARHWDALMAATQKKIALDDPAFSLQQLLDLQVNNFLCVCMGSSGNGCLCSKSHPFPTCVCVGS